MTQEEYKDKIEKLEKAINSPATPELQKKSFRGLVEKLKAELATKEQSPNIASGVTKPFTKGQGSKVTDAEKEAEAKKRASKTYRPNIKKGATYNHLQFGKVTVVSVEKNTGDKKDQYPYIVNYKTEDGKDGGQGSKAFLEAATLIGSEKAAPFKKPGGGILKRREKEEKPVSKPAGSSYDCDDLIEKEKERKKKQKEAAEKRANEPKKTPATKNKIAIEKVAERVTANVQKRIDKGEVKRAELEKLIAETENLLKNLKSALSKL